MNFGLFQKLIFLLFVADFNEDFNEFFCIVVLSCNTLELCNEEDLFSTYRHFFVHRL